MRSIKARIASVKRLSGLTGWQELTPIDAETTRIRRSDRPAEPVENSDPSGPRWPRWRIHRRRIRALPLVYAVSSLGMDGTARCGQKLPADACGTISTQEPWGLCFRHSIIRDRCQDDCESGTNRSGLFTRLGRPRCAFDFRRSYVRRRTPGARQWRTVSIAALFWVRLFFRGPSLRWSASRFDDSSLFRSPKNFGIRQHQ